VSAWWRAGVRTPAWWLAAAVGSSLVAIDVAGQLQRGSAGGPTALFQLGMSSGIVVGLWAWAWRAPTRMGPLMWAWPTVWVAADLVVAFPDSRFVSTLGLALFGMGAIAVAQMALSYPNGRLEGRLAWFWIFLMGYAAQVIQNVVNLFYYDARGCGPCSPRAPTFLHLGSAPFSLLWWNKGWAIQIIVVLPIGLYLMARRYLDAGPGARRTRGPLLLTSVIVTCTTWAQLILFVLDKQQLWGSASYVENAGLLAVPLTSLFGLALTRRARGAVGDLVVELGRARAGGARAALARAIGDPTLELALWMPERGVWADEHGRELELPEVGGRRGVTFVGEKLAAIVHDPLFFDQPSLLEAAGSAARFAFENERLHAQLRSQLEALRDSRRRIVETADAERRRLERDLHDGAQQRLLGLGMALQLLRTRLNSDPDASALLTETEAELQQALAELRELARGIHPAVLTDQGLGAAVRTLAARASIPVEVRELTERLPPHFETAAYFVVAEALANVAKYAQASKAWVTLGPRENGHVVIEVCDDGIGGADPSAGSGLRGLSDRVGALDGALVLDSPPGGGTRIRAELPCVS
jgi:signal transduction histidine kinase